MHARRTDVGKTDEPHFQIVLHTAEARERRGAIGLGRHLAAPSEALRGAPFNAWQGRHEARQRLLLELIATSAGYYSRFRKRALTPDRPTQLRAIPSAQSFFTSDGHRGCPA